MSHLNSTHVPQLQALQSHLIQAATIVEELELSARTELTWEGRPKPIYASGGIEYLIEIVSQALTAADPVNHPEPEGLD